MAARDLPDDAARLARHARAVLKQAAGAELMLATAESCTGGLLASLLTDIEGLSSTFERGFVTYSEAAKCEQLGVEPILIAQHGVVSAEVARAMAQGAQAHSRADIAIAITGFAGAARKGDEVGLVHIAARRRGGRCHLREARFGDVGRDRIRMLTVSAALEMIGDVAAEAKGQAASR